MFLVSRLELTCRTTTIDDQPPICTAFDGSRTGLFAVDPIARRVTALAWVTGRFYPRGDSGPGQLNGWLDRAPVVFDPATDQAIRIAGRDGERLRLLAVSEKTLGAVSSSGNVSIVRIYPME